VFVCVCKESVLSTMNVADEKEMRIDRFGSVNTDFNCLSSASVNESPIQSRYNALIVDSLKI
jgi:hypothetical protein